MRIVIVGGVAGGMSCAARARRLDEQAEIIVLERGEHVSFANCGLPYHVGGEVPRSASLLVQTPQTLREALDLDVRVHHDVTGVDAQGKTVTVQTSDGEQVIAYDKLVLSPGAKAFVPPLPGIDTPRALTLRTVDDAVAMKAVVDEGAKRAVVLGGGFIGLEAAESLAVRGLEVSVVELAPHILGPLETESASIVADELRRAGVHIYEGVAAERVERGEQHDTVVLADGTEIAADLIVLSVGVRPDTQVFEQAGVACERGAMITDEHGRTNLADVWAVGDAVLSTDAVTGARRPVALAGPASRAGRAVADDIVTPGRARPIPTALGTAIVRVGSQAAGMTGANRAGLDAAGIEYHTIHLHPYSHVSWFPGAEEVHLIVHFAKADGRILGGQAVGRDGADKRVDVLATAIRARMRIDELIDLDLAYAPPFGAAKDAITMAGMIGENVLDGTLRLWYAQDVDEVMRDTLVLDVRRDDEWETGHLPDALHIPHTELRGRIDEVTAAAAGRPVRIMCQSGVRSYIAHRVLAQAGFDTASLSGGMITLRQALGARAEELLV